MLKRKNVGQALVSSGVAGGGRGGGRGGSRGGVADPTVTMVGSDQGIGECRNYPRR